MEIKFGLDTFGDMTLKDDGTPETAGQVLRNVVAEAVHAEAVGLDSFDIGEHHRDDFAVTSPDTVLAGRPSASNLAPESQFCPQKTQLGFTKLSQRWMLFQMVEQKSLQVADHSLNLFHCLDMNSQTTETYLSRSSSYWLSY
jgi:hypothetical protein